MSDLTAITTPFGLLDTETQEALWAHGGPYEWYMRGEWRHAAHFWTSDVTYRVKPPPPKPREWWIVGGCEAYESQTAAINAAASLMRPSVIHVREVLE